MDVEFLNWVNNIDSINIMGVVGISNFLLENHSHKNELLLVEDSINFSRLDVCSSVFK